MLPLTNDQVPSADETRGNVAARAAKIGTPHEVMRLSGSDSATPG